MVTIIWVLKGLIALLFTFTGINKLSFPKNKLLDKGMKGLRDLDERQIKVIGFLEILGVLGLTLPTLLNIYPVISAISAVGLSLAMVVAGWIHHKLKLSIVPNIAVFVICISIAIGQLMEECRHPRSISSQSEGSVLTRITDNTAF